MAYNNVPIVTIDGYRDGKFVGTKQFFAEDWRVPMQEVKEAFGIKDVHFNAKNGPLVGTNGAGYSNVPFPEECKVYGTSDKGQGMIVQGPWGPVKLG